MSCLSMMAPVEMRLPPTPPKQNEIMRYAGGFPPEVFGGGRWEGDFQHPTERRLMRFITVTPTDAPTHWSLRALLHPEGVTLAPKYDRTPLEAADWLLSLGIDPDHTTWNRAGAPLPPKPTPSPKMPRRKHRPLPIESVYFAVTDGALFVKIGYTANSESRCADLQTGCPFVLKMAAVIPGTLADEFALHQKFAQYRVHGEWFHLSPEVAAYIEELNKTGPPRTD